MKSPGHARRNLLFLTFLNADGTPFALKPGKTWVEVMAFNTVLEQQKDGAYRFNFITDW